ncbi:3659_t:CDS:2, partial [Cetraspora pellucida]
TLQQLITLKAEDPEWVVVPNIEDADPAMGAALKNMWPTTHHSHCIFHLNNNFVKKLKPIMGKSFEECYWLFYSFRNSLLEIDFEHRWMRFVEF